MPSVRQAGQRITQGITAGGRGLGACVQELRRIVEDLDGASDLPKVVVDGCCAHPDWHAVAVGVAQPHLELAGLVIAHGGDEGTDRLAELLSGGVDMCQDAGIAVSPHHHFGIEAGYPFSPAIPVSDAAFPVDEVDAIGKMVHQRLVEGLAEGVWRQGDHRRAQASSGAGPLPSRHTGQLLIAAAARATRTQSRSAAVMPNSPAAAARLTFRTTKPSDAGLLLDNPAQTCWTDNDTAGASSTTIGSP